jgi:hypothetical protein
MRIKKHLGELKQRRIATTRADPKKIDLGEPVAFWTRGDEEFADKVIQQHFDEDRWPQATNHQAGVYFQRIGTHYPPHSPCVAKGGRARACSTYITHSQNKLLRK